jgi:hypothetical protein
VARCTVRGTTQEAALSYSTNATASYRGLVVNSDVRAGDFTYDVALSFAGEQRAYVQRWLLRFVVGESDHSMMTMSGSL